MTLFTDLNAIRVKCLKLMGWEMLPVWAAGERDLGMEINPKGQSSIRGYFDIDAEATLPDPTRSLDDAWAMTQHLRQRYPRMVVSLSENKHGPHVVFGTDHYDDSTFTSTAGDLYNGALIPSPALAICLAVLKAVGG